VSSFEAYQVDTKQERMKEGGKRLKEGQDNQNGSDRFTKRRGERDRGASSSSAIAMFTDEKKKRKEWNKKSSHKKKKGRGREILSGENLLPSVRGGGGGGDERIGGKERVGQNDVKTLTKGGLIVNRSKETADCRF